MQERTSGGAGCICASTVVYRAPSDEFKPLVPYAIVLVDLDDGPRVMGHAAAGLTVGARVRGESRQIVGRAIAYFSDVAK
ncbi:hypothetical protein AU184_08820 [Mycolicibacterium novocastrense]|nr:hypothetical protein AU184_08820 [Mycolicibacterium novocastrense]KUH71367.1 hypothetical protein AU183_06190 [Mycolicibacterium novocastrense]KUH74431.1 hypothetical protein AU072_17605 [Mycolicibacterium novocastrense]